MKGVIALLKRNFHQAIAYLVGVVLRPGAVYDPKNFKYWESRGYHITPVHFYSPIPNIHELAKKDFPVSAARGIDLNPEFQLGFMREISCAFEDEYQNFDTKPTRPSTFYLDNDAFSGVDPFVYYCMIRHFRPKTVLEIGSGHSTLLGAQAGKLNATTRYLCVDPWPRDFIMQGVPNVEFIHKKAEDLSLDVFRQLQANDILFIDSSHVIKSSSEVCFLILEVLPLLAPGVIVHFHDIFLPFDYPKEWFITQLRFWTEQYLLQAYLIENKHVEVLFANHFLTQKYPTELQHVFPNALSIHGGSFWFRKC